MDPASILIVEDEGLIALDLKTQVESAGYPVVSIVDTLKGAIQKAQEKQPNLVLMDIRIKGPHDGIEAARQLQDRFDIPVIFVTAHADTETLERAKLTGPMGYIVKPFVNVDFRAQIEIALWKHAMERKLRVSEAWLAATLRNVGDAVLATNFDGQIAAINRPAAELTGWDTDEARDKLLLEVFSAFDVKTGLPMLNPLETLCEGRELGPQPRLFQLKHRTRGDFKLVEATISANRDAGKLLGVIVVFRDISERRRMQEREQQLDKMQAIATLGTALGSELGGVLRKIVAFVNMHEPSKELSAWMDHATGLAQQMTLLGQANPAEREVIDLNRMIQNLLPQFDTILTNRDVRLALQRQIPAIKADANGLRENLVRIANEIRKDSRRKGHVQITTRTNRNWSLVELVVEDLGKPPKELDTKEAASAESKSETAGAALVHCYMAMQGGKLVTTRHAQRGSTYEFTFPALPGSTCVPESGIVEHGKAEPRETLRAG